MKICFICYDLTGGGAQRVVSVLSNALVERHEITVIVKERKPKEYALDPRVRIITMDDDQVFRTSRNSNLAAIPLLRRIFRQEKPDFVFSFLGYIESGYLASLGLKSVRYITTIRNSPWSKPERKLLRITRDLTVMLSHACMIQNQEQGTYFPSWVQKKLFVVPNAVNPAYADCPDHEYRPIRKIVTLGRLHVQKNQEMMIRAFASIVPEIPDDVVLEIYGDGDRKEKLETTAVQLGIGDQVKILPFQADALGVYQNADLFLLSSDFEGMPNALLEAMAVGLPCISTDCRTGPKDMIRDGENGYLVKMGDTQGMAERMLRLIREPRLAETLGREARKTVKQQYVLEAVISRLEKELERLVK